MAYNIENLTFLGLLDFFLVVLLFFLIYRVVKNSIAKNVLLGILILYLFYILIKAIQLEHLSNILGEFMRWGVLGLIIIFQQEIRRFLQAIGQSASFQNNPYLRKLSGPIRKTESQSTLQAILDSVRSLATAHIGALIVIHKYEDLSRFIDSGDILDATVSKRLIISIFSKNSPLHDGAIIIQDDRIKGARCMLPVSESGTISPNLGFRHRAAIGMSEQSDAAIIVVSEENGEIGLIYTGNVFRNLSIVDVESKLNNYLEK